MKFLSEIQNGQLINDSFNVNEIKTKMKSQSNSKPKSEFKASMKEEFFDNILDIDISKPLSAHNFFYKEMWKNEESKRFSISEYSKICNEKFKKLSEKEKRKYDDLKEKDRERYESNLRLVKMYLVDLDKLKNTSTAFSLFKDAFVYQEINENNRTYEEASKNAKESWEGLSDNEKDEWRNKFKEDQEITKELRYHKPGKVSAYMCFVQHQTNFLGIPIKEAKEKWTKLTKQSRENYEMQAYEQNKEKERLRDLYEIAAGEKPKQPMGAFSIYLSQIAASGAVNKKNFLNEGIKLWSALPQDEKDEYYKQHKILSLKYQIKKEYYLKLNYNHDRTCKVSGYNLFVKEMSEEYKGNGLKKGELFNVLNKEWRILPESEKLKFKKKAEERNQLLGLKRSKILDEKPNKPSNAYMLFMKDNTIELKKDNAHKSKNQSELMIIASQNWNNINESEKAKYDAKSLELKEDYNEKMIQYEKNLDEYEFARGRKSHSKVSQAIQSNISKKLQSKSKFKSQTNESTEFNKLAQKK